jgi:hypothetical protein
MATILNQTISSTYENKVGSPSLYSKFLNWTEAQSENRLLWIGIILAGHGCILTPLTVMAVLLAGTNLFLFMLAIAAMGMALVTNLAALPTKITIPVFFLSILIDIIIIITTMVMGFDITSTYI